METESALSAYSYTYCKVMWGYVYATTKAIGRGACD